MKDIVAKSTKISVENPLNFDRKGEISYHDFNHTLGSGGGALYTTQLWIGNAFDRYEIVESGSLCSVFTLQDWLKVYE